MPENLVSSVLQEGEPAVIKHLVQAKFRPQHVEDGEHGQTVDSSSSEVIVIAAQ